MQCAGTLHMSWLYYWKSLSLTSDKLALQTALTKH